LMEDVPMSIETSASDPNITINSSHKKITN